MWVSNFEFRWEHTIMCYTLQIVIILISIEKWHSLRAVIRMIKNLPLFQQVSATCQIYTHKCFQCFYIVFYLVHTSSITIITSHYFPATTILNENCNWEWEEKFWEWVPSYLVALIHSAVRFAVEEFKKTPVHIS